ncbi:uncharacterized protein N7511_001812 [Penicillium nucicola]|uniref:uncharacterized protein n=1 Tax=Penicillium nucicola TaxID=1850975 RepID=UPI0025452683|nr:uncharacterized protein N7511_001812 [Penicillium nucicola]KAJ5769761.1 hypothetical protein N7511_001812 [Penicillium nucicola]
MSSSSSTMAQGGPVHDIPAHFLHSPVDRESTHLPNAISHRGFKGQYPENTLLAIDEAIKAGTQALELDLHISRDGEVVLSHDASLKRCFGVKKKVAECDWEYLNTLRTVQAPHEPMPRLVDVLEYLRQAGREHIWVMLDIKLTNEPAEIMQRIAQTIETVPIPRIGPDWHRRVVLGCWSSRYLPARTKYLPRYAVSLVCVDVGYARQFLQVPRLSFNINQMALMGPLGRGFLEEAQAARRRVYVWTVNAPNLMRWCIRHKIDGVISDEPGRFRQVCAEWEKEQSGGLGLPDPKLDRITLRQRVEMYAVTVYVVVFGWLVKRKYFPPLEQVHFEENKLE